MPKGKPHPRLSSSDDDEDDTTPLCELKGVQAAKTAKTVVAAFKEKAAADKKAAAELRKQLQKRMHALKTGSMTSGMAQKHMPLAAV